MSYIYYPGCSLEGSAREYNTATRMLFQTLGVELVELANWTCCGASAAEASSNLLAATLAARNIALAEQAGTSDEMLVPCSACYLNLKTVAEKMKTCLELREQVNQVLAVEGLQVTGNIRVRHLLDVLYQEIGPAGIQEHVQTTLEGLTIACYYGCQCLRPYAVFDDPEKPRSMEQLIAAAGARVHPWAVGTRCCGASHMMTRPRVGICLVAAILEAARGADAIVTVCPMCQMNLEAYQKKVSVGLDHKVNVPVLYLPQLLGVALGLAERDLELDANLSMTAVFADRLNHLSSVPRNRGSTIQA